MTREDRAREAEEYRRATTQEVYRYHVESIKILNDGTGVLGEIEAHINDICLSGYRLHTIEFKESYLYVVYERLETVDV